MNLLLGFFGLAVNLLVVSIIIRKHKGLTYILLTALIVRVLFVLVNNYVVTLPDGVVDAVSFEEIGWNWNIGNQLFYEKLVIPSTFFYSWIIGFIYSIFDRSILLIQSLSVLAGVGIVYISWKIGRLLFNESAANKAAIILCLHPVLVMYSALTMREVFIVFFLLLSIYKFIKWVLKQNTLLITPFFFAFIAMSFHGAMFIMIPIYMGIIFFNFLRDKNFSFYLAIVCIVLLAACFIIAMVGLGVEIPKFNTVESAINPERWLSEIKHRSIGGSAYPDYLNVTSAIDLLWAVPVRFFYFLFSPFVWDIRAATHIFGFVDALFYIYMVTILYINRQFFTKRRILLNLIFAIFSIAFVFSIGTGNFGSAVRHRAKLLPVLVILYSAIQKRK